MWVRPPVVAGRFYPSDPGSLREQVQDLLAAAGSPPKDSGNPKALIVPHAGYVYSGAVAASGHAWLRPSSARIHRVVLLGTCHAAVIQGLATTTAGAFQTPLGRVEVDKEQVERALGCDQVRIEDLAHNRDHSLEVQLPFLQVVLESFRIVPFLVGQAEPSTVAAVLDALWEDEATVIVVSSDLSHHQTYEQARRLDLATAEAIERGDAAALGPRSACGRHAIAGLLQAAGGHGLSCRRLDLRSSGDTAGPRDQVVGYGAWAFLP